MRFNSIFQTYFNCSNETEVFQYFQNTLTDSISVWNYFVDWEKVLRKFNDVEINLNILNYLVGKNDIENEFGLLLQQHPQIVSAIPILIACRTTNFQILTDYTSGDFVYKSFNFKRKDSLSQLEINDILEFTKNTGVLELFKNKNIKSIPDYVLGIEVGLDSNGRKNRGGMTMEIILGNLIRTICQQNNFLLIPQATSQKIQAQWNINVQVDKSNRRFDFAVKNQNNLYLIEANFYSGGGSKLKSTAGEYKTLFDFVSRQGHKFIWVTDGLGWKTTLHPLEETFKYIDYTLNLNMVVSGLLG
ncbi:restriction endonuclease [Nostoc sp. 'Peltigera membranacea cyanobiont' 213]|uniref:type II restriction endonuclease n=1 Tax=Nostoc sp. 'Peltigera membranacea cyanobiont' 213 TaxID=2014530 RepID=UPI000B9556A7|nr:type II restriction endonuclease [Nostoc sp. 'Peltigera membranacea cyanobiont' 213]OYD91038.1 restriction endonuclease [Nostoc sp. 'Peltigera membranacea cyanobiont' 213]